MISITDMSGNLYEFNPDNGLISRNNVILSGAEYEPVFSSYLDNSAPPFFVGIYFKLENKVLSISGRLSKLINSRTL